MFLFWIIIKIVIVFVISLKSCKKEIGFVYNMMFLDFDSNVGKVYVS